MAYKPGSVSLRTGESVIYLLLPSPTGSSGPPSDVGRATLLNAGLHDLTTPKMHSPYITIRLVGSYPTFSPLPPGGGGYFLLHYSTLTDSFLLGSRMLCVARTFLFYHYNNVPATDRPTAFFVQRYANKRNLCYNCQDSFDSGVWETVRTSRTNCQHCHYFTGNECKFVRYAS